MPTAMIGIAFGDIAIALAMVCLLTTHRTTFGLRWWAGAFAADAARHLVFLLVLSIGPSTTMLVAEVLQTMSAALILGGVFVHLGMKVPRIFLAASVVASAVWAAVTVQYGLFGFAGHLPSTILIFIAAGFCLNSALRVSYPVMPVVAAALILVGVQRLAHPLVMTIALYTNWHFFVVLGLNLLAAFSFIMLVQRREQQRLQDARDRLAESKKQLRASEERFRDVAESSSDWMWEMDADLRYTYFSDRLTEVTGLDPKNLIGKTRRSVTDREDEEWLDHLRTLEAHKPYRDFQYKTIAIDGSARHFRVSGKPTFDKDGKFTGYRGIGTDVTAEVETEKKFNRAREILNTAVGALGEGFALFDQRDRLVTCNKTFRECYPLLGRKIRRGVSFEKLAEAMVQHGQVLGARHRKKGWLKERLAAHADPKEPFEEQLADGRWVQVDEIRIADGWSATTLVDITALKRRQEASALLAGAGTGDENMLGVAAQAIAVGLGYRWAGVCSHSADGKRAKIAALSDNGIVSDGPDYELVNTPCQVVVDSRTCFVPNRITEAFPEDELLIEMGAETYQGQLVYDRSGARIGHIFACDDKPDPSSVGDPELMNLVAQWIGVELERRAGEVALKESEERLRDFAEASSDWFWELDADLRFSRIAKGQARRAGKSTNSIIGKRPDFMRPEGKEDDPAWTKHLQTLEAHKPFRNFVFDRIDKKGRTRVSKIDGRPIFDANKNFLGYRGTGTDITAQVEAEHQAKVARGQLLDAIESLQEGFVLYGEDRRLVICNTKYREFFFPDDFDFIKPGMKFEEILKAWAKANVKQFTKGGSTAWIKERLTQFDSPGEPIERWMKDGRIILTREYKTRDGGTVGVHTDITEERRARARLADAIESVPAGFLLCDAEDNIVAWNATFADAIPKGLGNMLKTGMSFDAYIKNVVIKDLVIDASKSGEAWLKKRFAAHRKPGAPFETQFSDGRIYQIIERKTTDGGTVSVYVDITDHKIREDALEKAQATLQTVLETVDQGFSMFDADLNLVAFNAHLERLQKLPQGRFKLGDNFADFVRYFAEQGEYGEGDIEEMIRDRVEQAKKFESHHFERTRPDGQVVEIRGNPVPGGGGFVTTHTDVTERKQAEQELRSNEERTRGILEHVADGIITIDQQGKIESFNPAAESMFGYSAEEAIGSPVAILMTGEDKRNHNKYIAGYENTGKSSIIDVGAREVLGRRKDGSMFPISLAVGKVSIGERKLFIGSLRDITERKNREAELDKARAVLQMVLDNLDQGISMFNAELRADVFNDRYLELLDFPKDKFRQGDPFDKFIRFNAERGEYGEGDVDKQVNERVVLARKFEAHIIERQRPDGLWLEIRGNPLPDGGGFVTTYTDITDRNKADEALRASEERYALAMEGAGEGLWDWDIDNDTIYLSRRLREFFGLEHDDQEVDSEVWQERIHDEDRDRHYACLVAHLRGEIDHFESEFRMRNAVGEHRWMLNRGVALHDYGGRAHRMAGSIHDITERKRAEQDIRDAKDLAEAASITKSRFLATMSHELRTPLNAIIGFSEMMKSEMFGTLGNPHYAEYARDINESGSHLLNLINDILDVSKLEAGKIEIFDTDCDVGEIIAAANLFVREQALEGDVEIEAINVSGLPPLRADERRLKQVLINLMSNAVKFTLPGGKITVSARAEAATGYILEVRDTGIGIAPDDISKALEPFAQIDSTLSRRFEGTGLGLPLTRSLVELHGGSIGLQSELGEGTLVTVTFPPDRIVQHRAAG